MSKDTKQVAEQQRKVQAEQDAKDASEAMGEEKEEAPQQAVQAGHEDQPENPLPAQHLADRPADQVKDFGKKTDMKRPAQPEELSPAFVFLAAPCCASYISGIVLPVTGSVGAI